MWISKWRLDLRLWVLLFAVSHQFYVTAVSITNEYTLDMVTAANQQITARQDARVLSALAQTPLLVLRLRQELLLLHHHRPQGNRLR